MKIDHYVQGAFREMLWWQDQLSEADVDAVRSTASEAGAECVRAMICAEENASLALLVRPEAERVATLSGLAPRDRHLTLLAAAYIARSGYAWLLAASDSAADPSIDVHPVTMLLRARHAATRFEELRPTLWPFDDGTDPFGEDQAPPA